VFLPGTASLRPHHFSRAIDLLAQHHAQIEEALRAGVDNVELRAGMSWPELDAALCSIKIVEYQRGTRRVLQTTEIQPEARALLRRLDIPPPPSRYPSGNAARPGLVTRVQAGEV
jgi:hypothetical protein